MPTPPTPIRRLLTAPPGRPAWTRELDPSRLGLDSLWIAPTPAGRDQVARALSLAAANDDRPGVAFRACCWDDLWALATLDAASDPPAAPSPVGLQGVLDEAIIRAREADSIGALGDAVDRAGFRRRILRRFLAWDRAECSTAPGKDLGAFDRAERVLFGFYRGVLDDLRADSPGGVASWASRRIVDHWPRLLGAVDHLVAIEPIAPSPAMGRVLEAAIDRVARVSATLPYRDDDALGEMYRASAEDRRWWLDRGFVEEPAGAEVARGWPGFGEVEAELFRADAHARPSVRPDGLRVVGGPRGEGLGLLVAREVSDALDEGFSADEVAVVVPRLDDDAEAIRRVMASWGLPVEAEGPRRLATIPSVSALRLALRVPAHGWEVDPLVRLLRNGLIDWSRVADGAQLHRYEAASAIQSTRVYRSLPKIERALDRRVGDSRASSIPFGHARQIVAALAERLGSVDRPGDWRIHVARVDRLAQSLGLDARELTPLRDALDDLGWVVEHLGAPVTTEPWSFGQFFARLDRLIDEAEPIASPDVPGRIRLLSVEAARGCTFPVVIFANLAEKTFPSAVAATAASAVAIPEAPIEPDPPTLFDADLAVDPAPLAYSREMLRFLAAIGSADRRLVLAYPTTDLNGESLLPAGFLDELLERLDPEARGSIVETHRRFHPVLSDQPDLARSPNDRRVLAVDLARRGLGTALLDRVAASEPIDGPLRGVAEAFRVGILRRSRADFANHDGILLDLDAVDRIRDEFGPAHNFSASKLESYATCPFQFFQKYVLGLRPGGGAEELAEDYAERGRSVHEILETTHRTAVDEGVAAEGLLVRLGALIETRMDAELARFDPTGPDHDVAEVLKEIETLRTGKALARYLAQFRAYESKVGVGAVPRHFEVRFRDPRPTETPVDPDAQRDFPAIQLGDGLRAIRLEGSIDRVDHSPDPGGGPTRFRVIDYKTGSKPQNNEVLAGLASQLPLYAIAAERLLFAPGESTFLDAGYWSLPGKGYAGVKLPPWEDYRGRLIEYVLRLADRLRNGAFPVDSQASDCTSRCDYQASCRVREVRQARKRWRDRPKLEAKS